MDSDYESDSSHRTFKIEEEDKFADLQRQRDERSKRITEILIWNSHFKLAEIEREEDIHDDIREYLEANPYS